MTDQGPSDNSFRSPQQDQRRCCACGGDNYSLLCGWEPEHPRNSSKIPLSMWQCECGLAILHPIPQESDFPASNDWWAPQRQFMRRNPGLKRIRNKVQNAIFGTQKQRLIRQTRKAVPRGRLLDIGCGTGELLRTARPYFQCTGLEPSPTAAQAARDLGFKIIESTLEEAEIQPEAFDVVTMDAVLEHLVDPVSMLSKVNRVLRPGGVVAVKVPKLFGPAHRRHGREWNGFRVGYHFTLFTGSTLAAVMHLAGFDALESPCRDRPLDDILLMWGRKVRVPQEASRPAA